MGRWELRLGSRPNEQGNARCREVDVSLYNVMIGNVKVAEHDLDRLNVAIREITEKFRRLVRTTKHEAFERDLKAALSEFNKEHFPSPEFKRRVRKGEVDQYQYGNLDGRIFDVFTDRCEVWKFRPNV